MSDRGQGVIPGQPATPVRDALSGDTAVAASCAAAALLTGALVYLLIRPDVAAFVPRALHRPLLLSPVITHVAQWLPTLCHVLGFSLATALVAGLSRRTVIASAARGSRLRGWRSAVHKSGGIGEICRLVGRRSGKPASPAAVAAVAAGILDWQTQLMGCLKCLFPSPPGPARGFAGDGSVGFAMNWSR